MKFYCHEIVQRWISSNGKVTDMALLRGFPFYYCDVWALDSDMEVRPHNSLYDEVVAWSDVYPRMSILPQLKRNGFKAISTEYLPCVFSRLCFPTHGLKL